MLKTSDLGQTRIDPRRRKFRALLENLQGSILKPRGRENAVLIFFRITPRKAANARAWLRGFADTHVTSSREQIGRSRSRRPFCSVLLSAAGYHALGKDLQKPADLKFQAGMKSSGASLRDSAWRSWEKPYRGEVHVLVIVGDEKISRVNQLVADVRKGVKSFGKVVAVERGRERRNADGQVVEHFGYADGLSQPRFLKIDRHREARGGKDAWDPSAPLRLVLVRDPNARAVDAFGSYLVFRKLEQNVLAFRKREKDMTRALALSHAGAGLAGALMVGRFQGGTPLALRGIEGKKKFAPLNTFTYANDPKGSRCPFQAHIRALNPRNEASRTHRILRCGITYGDRRTRKKSFTDGPAPRVGLLFMCFQRSIGRQFEWLQRRANERAGRPMDSLIGQGSHGVAAPWPTEFGKPTRVRYPSRASLRAERVKPLVTLRGGEYFFAPSLPFLTGL